MNDPKKLPSTLPFRPAAIFTDVDDTLTLNGKLPLETFQALHRLKARNIPVIPVTGACSGWCDCIIRTWPVDTIIGENGAVIFDNANNPTLEFIASSENRQRYKQQLSALAARIAEAVPEAQLTHDTMYRATDIAFDIGQDHFLPEEQCDEIMDICRKAGATARRSSIHINIWFGNHTKATTAYSLMKRLSLSPEQVVFIGDSANDEDMFHLVKTSFGVSNIEPFLERLQYKPTYITSQPGGLGFAELVNTCLLNSL